jgi:hypothetical protein
LTARLLLLLLVLSPAVSAGAGRLEICLAVLFGGLSGCCAEVVPQDSCCTQESPAPADETRDVDPKERASCCLSVERQGALPGAGTRAAEDLALLAALPGASLPPRLPPPVATPLVRRPQARVTTPATAGVLPLRL